jgi:selenocysteine lyase/cysteine desulfurase
VTDKKAEALAELQRGVRAALETYANVHRGSGHHSMVSTHLFDQARDIVLECLGLDRKKYVVVFCTARGAELLEARLRPGSFGVASSQDIGLSLGVRALAVQRRALPKGPPVQTGGGTARLVSPGWVVWAAAPDRFEAGTPSIVNVIAFAKALRLVRHFGQDALQGANAAPPTPAEILCRDDLEALSGRELLVALRRTLVGRGVLVPTVEGVRPFVNLDNAASTPTFEPIWKAACQAWRLPRQVQQGVVHDVAGLCAEMLGAPSTAYDVVFTSNTTEAINLAAESLRNEPAQGAEPVVLNTLLEHNSNELPWRAIPGVSLIRLPVDPEGFVDPEQLEALLSEYNRERRHGQKRIGLVAVSGASNVLGACNDLEAIGRIVHSHGARMLVDAAQLVAHRKVDMEAWGIDYLAFSGHKVYAPFGSGALLARKGLLHFSPAQMELIRSSGEENVAGIAGLGKALVLLRRIGLDTIQEEEQTLTAHALRSLAPVPGLRIYGVRSADSPRFACKGGVIAFDLKGVFPDRVARALAERAGIGVRYGCHCAHLLIKRLLGIPPLLERFQGLIVKLFPRLNLPGVVRVSIGIENSREDIDTLVQALGEIAGRGRVRADGSATTPNRPRLRPKDVRRQMSEAMTTAAERVYATQARDSAS